jgi:cyclohexa-1,5-dienecarbonyl-CoA hydratase
MAPFEKIRVESRHAGQVARLLLHAPEGNVLDTAMMAELTRAVAGIGPEVKALVLEGAGAHFSFGASIGEHREGAVAGLLAAFHRLLRGLIDCGLPAVAVVRGRCLGGGLELAAFCHWILASREATFGQPEIALGVFPPAACLILPWRIGQSAADDLVLSGRTVAADEARRLGLVHAVADDPAQELETLLARAILPRSAAALRLAARASRHAMHESFLARIEALERLYLEELMRTRDAHEGVAAFLEKREPRWQDR